MNTKTAGQGQETQITVHKGEAGEISKKDERRLLKAKLIIERAVRSHGSTIFAIGKALIEAKQDLAHGTFLSWVDENLPFKRRTAQMYMRIYDALHMHDADLGVFQLTTLNALASAAVSAADRENIIVDIRDKHLLTDDAVLERIAGSDLEAAAHLKEGKIKRNAARQDLAKLTYELAGDRLNEFIALLRAAGLADVANLVEDLATQPNSMAYESPNEGAAGDAAQNDETDPLPDFLPAHGV